MRFLRAGRLAVAVIVSLGFLAAADARGSSAATANSTLPDLPFGIAASPPGTGIPTPRCGSQLFPGITSGGWRIPGGGVPVYSNGPADEGTGSDCTSGSFVVNSHRTGEKYQCVEFVNRLYLTKKWINSPWNADAGKPFWTATPKKLQKQNQGAVSYLGPGDIVDINVYHYNTKTKKSELDGGHVLIVNSTSRITNGKAELVSQNSGYLGVSKPVVWGVISHGNVTVSGGGNGWSYTTIGVIHAPIATKPPVPTPSPSPSPVSPSWHWAAVSATGGDYNSLACPSTSQCVAVSGSGTISTGYGSSWQATSVGVSLTSVSCPAAETCVATGVYGYLSASGQRGALLSGFRSSWTRIDAPLPADANRDPTVALSQVACESGNSCVAVGQYWNQSNNPELLMLSGFGSSWKVVKISLPDPGIGPSSLRSVTCPSITTCIAVGSYTNSSGVEQGILLTGSGISWAASKAPLPAAAASDVVLSRVTCPTVFDCVAIGYYFDSSDNNHDLLLTRRGSSWTAATVRLPADAGSAGSFTTLNGIACPSPSLCTATGEYTDTSGGSQGLIIRGYGSSWAPVKAPLPAKAAADPQVNGLQVGCPSARTCVILGSYTDRSGNQRGLLLTGNGSSWAASIALNPADAGSNPQPLYSQIVCPSPASCVAAGNYENSSGYWPGLILTGSS